MTLNTTGEIACSVCGASNAADWLYCQQCGSPLKSEPASVARSASPSSGKPGEPPVDIPPTLVAPPVVPPTVVAQPAVPPPVPPTVVAQPVVPPTVVAQPAVPPPVPPTVVAQPSVSTPVPPTVVPPTVVAQPVVPPTVVAQPAVPPPVPPTVVAQPSVPPPVPPTVIARSPAAGGAADTVVCDQCGKINPATNSFCAGCGAPLPSPLMKTIVRTSERPPTRVARLCLIQEGGGDGEVYEIKGDELTIGRNSGDIRFPHDGYMSGRHARIIRRGDEFILQDDNSRNGTFKKIDGPVTLKSGDILLIGKQLFRFEV